MTNDDQIGEATLLTAAAAVEGTQPEPPVRTAGGPPEEPAVTGLQGNATTLVEIAVGSRAGGGEVVLVSRERRALAVRTPSVDGKLTVALAAGDYLVAAAPVEPARSRSNRAICRRVLVDAGRAYGYGMPVPLGALPAAHPDLDEAAPRLRRLAYTGSFGGAARLVVEWSPGGGQHCLCIRSPHWGGHWLPYAIPSATAFCLSDGAYEIRAAQLADGGTRLGPWSEIAELIIAEGRLAAAPSTGGGDVLDWTGVKPGWRPDGTAEIGAADVEADRAIDGKVAVKLAWQDAGSVAGLRYVVAHRRESGGDWETAVAASPEQTLQLVPGRCRLRICAFDDLVFLRSEFFTECVATVSASDPPVLMQADAAAPQASVVDWQALPEDGTSGETALDDAVAQFVARPISTLAAVKELSAGDLDALAYGQSPPPCGHDADIAVAGALAQGGLGPDQLAAAGDYFLRAGQLETAWHVFEALGRGYRGVDFAQLRCAQLAMIAGRDNEARELLTLALSPPKNDSTRAQSLSLDIPRAVRERTRLQQQALRAATAKADLLATRTGTLRDALENKARQYRDALENKVHQLEELKALRFKAQQYDRLMRELPALRYKAKRYDQIKEERAGRGNSVVEFLRRWSTRLPGLRPH